MAITKNAGRQEVIAAYVDIAFGDVPTTGTAYAAIDLPVGAQVVGGDLVVNTLWGAVTTATVDIGDATVGNRYGNDIDLEVAARTALTLTGFQTTATQPEILFTVTYTGSAANAGSARLTVLYIVNKRAAFSEG